MRPAAPSKVMIDGTVYTVVEATPCVTPFRRPGQDTRIVGWTLGLKRALPHNERLTPKDLDAAEAHARASFDRSSSAALLGANESRLVLIAELRRAWRAADEAQRLAKGALEDVRLCQERLRGRGSP